MNLDAIPPDALNRFRHAAALLTHNANSRASRLLTLKEDIATLRKRGISYRAISELLTQNGIPTSDISVMKFCHRVLKEKRPRKSSAKRRASRHANRPARQKPRRLLRPKPRRRPRRPQPKTHTRASRNFRVHVARASHRQS